MDPRDVLAATREDFFVLVACAVVLQDDQRKADEEAEAEAERKQREMDAKMSSKR